MDNNTGQLVSIVIPAYNALPYLEAALESVLAQDYPNVELIVLDDGSTDGTPDFLKKYKGRFHFESHENMGQAATLNKGWSMSQGSIIGYLSADDILEKHAVSATVKTFSENYDVVLTYPDNYIVDSNLRIIRKHIAPQYNYHDFIKHAKCRIGVGSFFLKSAFNKIGGWNSSYRLMPDYEYQLRLSRLGHFKRIPEILGYSRIHSKSISANKVSAAAADEFITVMKNEFKVISDEKLIDIKRKILSRSYLFSARTHLDSGRYKLGINYLGTMIKLAPSNLFKIDTYRVISGHFIKKLFKHF